MTTTHTDTCTECGRLLAPAEESICGPCLSRKTDAYYDPTDAELLRRDAITARFWLGDWAAVGLAVWVGLLLTTLVIGRELH